MNSSEIFSRYTDGVNFRLLCRLVFKFSQLQTNVFTLPTLHGDNSKNFVSVLDEGFNEKLQGRGGLLTGVQTAPVSLGGSGVIHSAHSRVQTSTCTLSASKGADGSLMRVNGLQ